MNNDSSLMQVAQIGRLVGLKGELKLHLHCDFPEQFQKGKVFQTDKGLSLEVLSYHSLKGLISFVGYSEREKAALLVNALLFNSVEASMRDCALKEGEFFWFEMLDARLIDDNGLCLGTVDEIERIASTDYLIVKTDEALISKGLAVKFYIPYIERYIVKFDKAQKEICTRDGLGILENS